MRWTYTSDDRNEMVVDGKRFYMYFPKDRYVSDVAITTQSSTGLLFLGGRVNIARDFVPSLPGKSAGDGMAAHAHTQNLAGRLQDDCDRCRPQDVRVPGFVVTDEEVA